MGPTCGNAKLKFALMTDQKPTHSLRDTATARPAPSLPHRSAKTTTATRFSLRLAPLVASPRAAALPSALWSYENMRTRQATVRPITAERTDAGRLTQTDADADDLKPPVVAAKGSIDFILDHSAGEESSEDLDLSEDQQLQTLEAMAPTRRRGAADSASGAKKKKQRKARICKEIGCNKYVVDHGLCIRHGVSLALYLTYHVTWRLSNSDPRICA